MPLFQTITDLAAGAEIIRARRYGVIEICAGRLRGVYFRPWPKFCSVPQVIWGQWYHRRFGADRCLLFFNQPRRASSFLALKYVVSGRQATFESIRWGLAVLDEIARIKRSDAIVTDVANLRISERMLTRWGWQAHLPTRWHRHYIKRFYGEYPRPAAPALWTARDEAALAV